MPSSSRLTTSPCAIQLVEPLPDAGRRAEQHAHLAPGGEGQHLLGVDVEGVGGGHFEVGIGLADRHHIEAAGHLLGHRLGQLGVDLRQIGHRDPEPAWRGAEDLVVAEELALDKRLPERDRAGLGSCRKRRDRLIGQQRLDGVDQPFVGELHLSALLIVRSGRIGGRGDRSEDKALEEAPPVPIDVDRYPETPIP